MKAKKFKPEKLELPCALEKKYDGVRLRTFINKYGKVEFRTYNDMLVSLPNLADEVHELNLYGTVLDTEITYGSGKLAGRSSISGAINSAIHGGTPDETDMVINVFDILSSTEWHDKIGRNSYTDRVGELLDLNLGQASIVQAEFTIVNSLKEINDMYEGLLEAGFEGIILKTLDHYYDFKRSWSWMKMKAEDPADLVCVGTKPGKPGTKYENMIGSLLCMGKVEDKTGREFDVKVAVGSGMSDIDRGLSPSYYIGSCISIKYNSIVQDSVTGGYSLFLPVYKERRFDK